MKKTWIACVCLAGVAVSQEQPGPERRLDARMVAVDVVVRNKSGPVSGLTKDDFTLLDKGKPQEIAIFQAVPEPDPNAKLSPPSPAVGSNRVTRAGATPQSATVILYDRVNTPVSEQAFARKQVLALLSSMKESDRFAFYSLARTLSVVTDFTDEPGKLIHAAIRLNANAPQAAPAEPAEQAAQKALEEALVPQQTLDNVYRVKVTAKAFEIITRHLAGLPGRKNVAWITRTFPLTFGADVNRRNELDKEISDATTALQNEDVALYPINPGGAGIGQTDTTTPNTPTEGRLMPRANSSISDAGAISDTSTMENIATATGGLAFYGINEISSSVRQVMSEAELSYRLGYYPDSKTFDGKPHSIEVKLARKVESGGVTLRYRKRYLASKQAPRLGTPAAGELAMEPLDATAVTLAGYSEPDPARAGWQKVHVMVDLRDLRLEHNGERWVGGFELGIYIVNANPPYGSTQTINLNLTDDQVKKAIGSGMIVDSAIDTKNQAVQIRAVVRDKTTGAAGSVRIPAGGQ